MYVFVCVVFFVPTILFAQKNTAFFKDAVKAERDSFYNKIVRGINRTITLQLDSTTDEQWQSAFYNIGFINYKKSYITKSIKKIAPQVILQSDDCKKAFLNLVNNLYPKNYFSVAKNICNSTDDVKLFAMGMHYMMHSYKTSEDIVWIKNKVKQVYESDSTNPILHELNVEMCNTFNKNSTPDLSTFFDKNYLPNTTIVFSFQRNNRNYPGLAMIRKPDGSLAKNDDGTYFSVPQLARSISNMPGYITNGNTPQGIFKMNGFDTSDNYFIGTTTNIQLAMPNEYNQTLINGDIVDTTWTLEQYKNLLPASFQNYNPMYGTFYAGKAGRTEIIAHGTTVNPTYYSSTSFYPHTPTMGCLTSVEIWNNKTGYLQKSNQQKLTDALQKNGVPIGYLIVIELADSNSEIYKGNMPVSLKDIIKYLEK